MATRLSILKTYKLFIGGKFPRTESGRTLTAVNPATQAHLAHYCRGSKKDIRDAIVAARAALGGWNGATAYLKGQILYRMAEMLESRGAAMAAEIAESTGVSLQVARREVEAAADCLVHFAGWTDKVSQVFGSVNPVATPHFNFTTPEPTGVVGLIAPDEPCLLGLVQSLVPIIAGGNTAVVVVSEKWPLVPMSFAEVLAVSDLPGGVVNLISGQRAELAPTLATHMDVNAVVEASGDAAIRKVFAEGASSNVKRVIFRDHAHPPDGYAILDTLEMKTAWHPIGL